MNVKAEIEIKDEELDLECNYYEQEVQIFPDNETDFASQYNIKIEELDKASSIKSELREIKNESMSGEKQVNNDDLKSESSGKFSFHLVKRPIGVADQELKSSGNRLLSSSVTFDQHITKKCQDYFRCRFCDFTFKNKDELTNHLKTHNKRKLKCAHCTYECNRKDDLKQHLQTHSNLKLFKCSVCSHECKRKGELKIHMLTHSNLKLFKCSECTYECKLKSHLNRHMLTYSVSCPPCRGGAAPRDTGDLINISFLVSWGEETTNR